MLDEQGWLDDVPTVPWQEGGMILAPPFAMYELNAIHHLYTVHPSLQFISHIPHSITGEQLMNQFLRCIPDKTWLFKYGRVPLNLIMGEWLWQVSSSRIASHTHPFRYIPSFLLFALSTLVSFSFRSVLCFFISTSGWEARFGSHGPPPIHSPSQSPPTRPIVPLSVPTPVSRTRVFVRPALFDLNGVRYETTPSPAPMSSEGRTN